MEQLSHKIGLLHFSYPCFRALFQADFSFAKYYCSNQCWLPRNHWDFYGVMRRYVWYFCRTLFVLFSLFFFEHSSLFFLVLINHLLSLNGVWSSETVKFKPYMMVVIALVFVKLVTFSLEKITNSIQYLLWVKFLCVCKRAHLSEHLRCEQTKWCFVLKLLNLWHWAWMELCKIIQCTLIRRGRSKIEKALWQMLQQTHFGKKNCKFIFFCF